MFSITLLFLYFVHVLHYASVSLHLTAALRINHRLFPASVSHSQLDLCDNCCLLAHSFMSKKRGLSLEDKRNQLLQIFHESQDFYLLRELEKLGPRKGVISQSVKDVIQSLVDDDLVFKDKIGTSVYFWSLPSSAGNQLRQVRAKLEGDLANLKQQKTKIALQIDSCKKGREDTEERETALAELRELEEKFKSLKAQMEIYVDNDPATFEAMKEACAVAHASVNRWTDNIFSLQQWCSSNFPDAKDKLEAVYKEVGITEDLDYLE